MRVSHGESEKIVCACGCVCEGVRACVFASASDLLMYLLIQKLAKEGKNRKQER